LTRNALPGAALAVVTVLLAAGCATTRGDAAGPQPLPAPGTRTGSLPRRVALPLDPYLASPRDRRLLAAAHAKLAVACMRRFGLDLPDSTPTGAMPPEGNQDRYGPADLQQVRVHGYHIPGFAPTRSPAEPELSAAQQAMLTGVGARQYAGQTVPEGGCAGEARRMLAAGARPPEDHGLAERLSVDSYGRSRHDRRVRAVFGAWSACMRRTGFGYTDPMQANDDPAFQTERPSASEIAVATADVACKQAVGLVGVWAAVEADYQRRALDRHREELQVIRRWLETQRRTAARIVAGQATAPVRPSAPSSDA
jgi:hypothetical protein